ncbi:SDR family oxidoreductase [Mucilaginibacter sp.]
MPFRTTVITGATSGIGKATTMALARKDHAIYLLVRNLQKGEQLQQEIIEQTGNQNIYAIYCDLADMKTVCNAAAELKGKLFAINTLINNAGGIIAKRELSKDGLELTFALNHMGHFLLTTALMPLLERGQARIINLSSMAHKMGRPVFKNLQFEHDYSAMKAYGQAKLFNVYFTKSLAERFAAKGITSYAVHPGIVNTGFGSELGGAGKLMMWLARPFMITPEEGAATSVYLAAEAKLNPKLNGLYFSKKQPAKTSLMADNVSARNRLWEISELIAKDAGC